MRSFIKDCLLFQGKDISMYLLGISSWLSLLLIIDSIVKIYLKLIK